MNNDDKPVMTAEEILKWCKDECAKFEPTVKRLMSSTHNRPMTPDDTMNIMAYTVFYNLINMITGKK